MKGIIVIYGLVLREKYGTEGISKNDVIDLFDMLDEIATSEIISEYISTECSF